MGPTKVSLEASVLMTKDAIVAMNKAVIVDTKSPEAVAKQFLQANNVL